MLNFGLLFSVVYEINHVIGEIIIITKKKVETIFSIEMEYEIMNKLCLVGICSAEKINK